MDEAIRLWIAGRTPKQIAEALDRPVEEVQAQLGEATNCAIYAAALSLQQAGGYR